MNKIISKTALRVAALAAAAGLTMAGCCLPAAAASAVRLTAALTQAQPEVPVLAWKACDDGFYCATARVPLNYRDPRGAKISIATISSRATGPGRSLGWLFFNGGGPSPQVVQLPMIYHNLPAAWRERYNLIMFDPRGMGYSTQIRCFPSEAAENKLTGNLPPFPVGAAQQATWDRAYAKLDARCAADAGPLLDHDTSADMARDMNLLREAVGDPVLNYYGESYGTLLGAIYANLFPATTGRMILDGNLNPVAWSTGGSRVPSQVRQDSVQASAATMTAFLDLCGRTSTAACPFSAGTAKATTAKWNTLLRRLSRRPVTVPSIGTVTYAVAIAFVDLSVVGEWQTTAGLLQQMWTASTGTHAVPSRGARAASPATAQSYYTGEEQNLAILCADSPNPRDPAAYAAAAELGTFAPHYSFNTEGCADWPAAAAQDRYAGPWNRPTASTILLLANTGDPVTAYQDSVAMSRDLARARLLTVDGYGHTTGGNRSDCAVSYVIQYTLTGALPAPGTVCPQTVQPFPAP
jgi:pimeloyl-ACP methyl ester carboxylesterase